MDEMNSSSSIAVPREVEVLLNPAYCAIILSNFVNAYASLRGSERALPFPLAFLVLPLVLHDETLKHILSHKATFGLHQFVRTHPELLAGLPNRIEGYRTVTRQAILFSNYHGLLRFDPQALLVTGDLPSPDRVTRLLPSDARESWRAARLLGTWYGQVSPVEVFIHLGIKPTARGGNELVH